MLGVARTGIIIESLLFSILAVAQQVLPRPQISSAVGKPVPNFALQDQHGKIVRFASLRGRRVLLIFYRGYW